MLTTQSQVRAAFWRDLDAMGAPGVVARGAPSQRKVVKSGWNQAGRTLYREARQNDYPADVRAAFVDYVDMLARSGEISEKLAQKVTL